MAREPKEEWYWPLGALDYAEEARDSYPEEAELLGIVTMLWTRQEIALGEIFVDILDGKPEYAKAIWNRQTTHQQRRELLALALETASLTDEQREILTWIIDQTKTLADRRNELIHAEYVVHGRTSELHAKVKSPRSTKPAKYQKVSAKDLLKVVESLEYTLRVTEGAGSKFWSDQKRATLDNLFRDMKGAQPADTASEPSPSCQTVQQEGTKPLPSELQK